MPLKAACLLLLACCGAAELRAADTRPNVLFILVDDMGFGDAGCYGGVGIPTPNIDRLAAQGTRFTQFYSASPICSPSRVGFTTGMFPARLHINSFLHSREGNRQDDQADFLDPQAPSLARILQGAGYATGHFGKWHMGGGRDVNDAPLPSAYGFDESLVNSVPLEGMGPAVPEGVPRWKTTSIFIARTLDFVRRQQLAKKPFYVNLWFSEVHDQHVPRPEDADPELVTVEELNKGYPKYPQTMDAFRRTLKGFDRDLGLLLDGLHELGLEESTLLVFTGDNGPNPLYDPAGRARTAGLRGQKWSLYEGGIREPFLVRWPGHVPAARVDDRSVLAGVDLLPTICALAGSPPPGDFRGDGENVQQAWLGGPWKRTQPLVWDYGRTATYLHPKIPGDRSPGLAIRDGQWKFLVNLDGTGAELYNLGTDPREQWNLAGKRPDMAHRLAETLLAWRKTVP